MPNVLYIANPNSIHDIKWMNLNHIDPSIKAFILSTSKNLEKSGITRLENAKYIGHIRPHSTVYPIKTLSELSKIKRIITKYKIDLIHILYAEPSVLWLQYKSIGKIPSIVTTRGTDILKAIPSHFDKKDLLNKVVSNSYKRAFANVSQILCTSANQVKVLNENFEMKNQPQLIRTGLDTSSFLTRSECSVSSTVNKPYILFPRGINRIYNHEFSIEALGKLSTDIKENFTMVFVGKGHGDLDYEKEMENLMHSMPDIDFIFLDQQSQECIKDLVFNSDLIVMNPHSDGSPVTAMEALLAGKKLILGPIEYDKEFLTENTFQLKDWNTNELALVIQQALSTKAKPIKIELLKDAFDTDFNMKKVCDVYRNCQK